MPALLSSGDGAELARQVAALRRLDLDDIGAEQRQLIGAVGPASTLVRSRTRMPASRSVMMSQAGQASPGTCSGPRSAPVLT